MAKRIMQGVVVSDKMDKTVVVSVERKVRHALYGKIVRKSKKYKAHDEENQYRTGDVVQIQESRSLSRDKNWIVIERTQAASEA
uniref:Small ribosomal subunit protein uS17 n=1 Tax=Magnetococcus massalia (strain MO-1) TaxID=451514 RepID=A0A1S7LLD5_MAGMO|nr:30S ribosomal protein S17 [Candidatus Magnetococcus massalia]